MDRPGPTRVTEAEYLARDAAAFEKSEFVNGEIIAMAGVTEAHSILRGNVLFAFAKRLHGHGPCRAHGSDLRFRIDETGMYAYPDVVVVCGPPEWAPTRPERLLNPSVLVEVLSESNADYDRGAKLNHYRLRPSVKAILLIDSRTRRVDARTRLSPTEWHVEAVTEGEVNVAGVDLRIPMDELYDGWTAAPLP